MIKIGTHFGASLEQARKGFYQILTLKWSPFRRSKLVPGQSWHGLRVHNAQDAEIIIFVIYYGLRRLPETQDFR